MGARTSRPRRPGTAATLGLIVGLVAACGGPAGSPRPTDPHVIVTDAVRATAALPSVRLHIEAATTMPAQGIGAGDGVVSFSSVFDGDVDLATRQFAGRQSTTFRQAGGAGAPRPAAQTTDVISTATGSFARAGGAARWTKADSANLNGGPTNLAIATALVALLDAEGVTYETADAVPCTLGTCDHVVVHVPGPAFLAALAPLLGQPGAAATMPDIDFDVRVDQATSLISEVRIAASSGGQTVQYLISLTNPGVPVVIVAPAPALVDDQGLGAGGGFGGGQVRTILEKVGSEISPEPVVPIESEPAP